MHDDQPLTPDTPTTNPLLEALKDQGGIEAVARAYGDRIADALMSAAVAWWDEPSRRGAEYQFRAILLSVG